MRILFIVFAVLLAVEGYVPSGKILIRGRLTCGRRPAKGYVVSLSDTEKIHHRESPYALNTTGSDGRFQLTYDRKTFAVSEVMLEITNWCKRKCIEKSRVPVHTQLLLRRDIEEFTLPTRELSKVFPEREKTNFCSSQPGGTFTIEKALKEIEKAVD